MRIAAALLPFLLASGAAAATKAEKRIDPRAQSVFERTKNTRATYAVYSWNWVKGSGFESGPHWSAEFNQGHLHRVETPNVRLVADCAAGTGTLLRVDTGATETGPNVAKAACGIDSNFPIRSLEWLGRKPSRFGRTDMIRILDPAQERIYAVDEAGALVAAEIFPRERAEKYCVQQEPLAVERSLPAGDLFSAESLSESFAAEKMGDPPAAAIGDLWLGSRRCVPA